VLAATEEDPMQHPTISSAMARERICDLRAEAAEPRPSARRITGLRERAAAFRDRRRPCPDCPRLALREIS
jgi:hypothetical protein